MVLQKIKRECLVETSQKKDGDGWKGERIANNVTDRIAQPSLAESDNHYLKSIESISCGGPEKGYLNNYQ